MKFSNMGKTLLALAVAAAMGVFPKHACADVITGIDASAGASATVYNNNQVYVQAPFDNHSSQAINNASVSTESASAAAATGVVTYSQDVSVETNGNVQQIGWQAEANSTASASASYGALHGYASATEQVLPGTFTYVDASTLDTVGFVSPLSGQAGASASAGYTERFFVNSSTLAFGTPVQALATFTLDGSTNAPLAQSIQPFSIFAYYDFEHSNPFISPDSLAQLVITNNGPSSEKATVLLNLFVGEQFGISGGLDVVASVPAYCSVPTCDQQTITSDARDTSNLYIDLQTPGTSLTTFSGHDYSTPAPVSTTPEPTTLVFIVTGFGGLIVGRNRFRR